MKNLRAWVLVSPLAALVAFSASAGCGSSNSGGSGGATGGGSGTAGASTGGSGTAGASTGGSGTAGASTGGMAGASTGGMAGASTGGSGGAGCVTLTVKNYKNWCSVSVAGGTAKSDAVQTVCVPPGKVNLAASPATATFELGPTPWHDTDGDSGSGDPGTVTGSGTSATSTTTVTVSGGSACVWVCCPFSSDGTGCNLSDQCP